MFNLEHLNENQKKAVEWTETPLLVLAGPGSGKTRVLISRIVNLLQDTSDQTFKILALTFTNKAAAEMRNRILEYTNVEISRTNLTTFHSIASEILQQHGSHIGIRPNFQILSNNEDRESLVDDVLIGVNKDLSINIPSYFTSQKVLSVVTKLLEKCISPENCHDFLESRNIKNADAITLLYSKYIIELQQANCLDFPSLIYQCLELFRVRPFLTKHYGRVYKHILVDEFQDTNESQYHLLKLLIGTNSNNLFVVADDDQIIYQWNGANPKRIHDLKNDFNVTEVQLPENYRCPPRVIELANSLISRNLSRTIGKKPLEAIKSNHSDETITVMQFISLEDELVWVSEQIEKKSKEERGQSVIIARTNKLIQLAGKALQERGISPYYASRKNNFLSAPFRMIGSALKLASNSEITVGKFQPKTVATLSKSFYEITDISVSPNQVVSKSTIENISLLEAWNQTLREIIGADSPFSQVTNSIDSLITSLNYSYFSRSIIDWAKSVLQKSEITFDDFEEELQFWDHQENELKAKFGDEQVSLSRFLQELDLVSKSPPKSPNTVPCLTIHTSKGMEFGHVFLIGMVEDQLPSWSSIKKGDESIEMQEERRNCFVAITRAEKTLTMTYSNEVFGWTKSPSRFLLEMGIDV